jgi:small subunit ribosomal protein S10
MDDELKSMQETIETKMEHLARDQALGTVEKVKELLASEKFRQIRR